MSGRVPLAEFDRKYHIFFNIKAEGCDLRLLWFNY